MPNGNISVVDVKVVHPCPQKFVQGASAAAGHAATKAEREKVLEFRRIGEYSSYRPTSITWLKLQIVHLTRNKAEARKTTATRKWERHHQHSLSPKGEDWFLGLST